MGLVTQLIVKIEGDASGLIGSLAKTQRASTGVFSEISRSAKAEFAAATKAADAGYKEVARLSAAAKRLDAAGNQSGLATALRSQAAAKAVEADKFAAVAVNAEKRIQAEAAKTVASHSAEAAGVSKLGGAYAQQGGAISRFFGAITAGSGGSTKAVGELKSAFTGLVSGGGISGLTNLASTGLKGLAGGLGTAGKAGEEAATGLAATGTAAEGATGGLAAMGIAGGAATAGLLAGAAAVAVLGKAIEGGTKHFLEYAAQTRQVQRLTGATAETASKLAGQFRHFGIDVDAGSKALGILAKNAETNSGKKLTDLGITIAHVGKTAKVDLLGTLENVGEAFKKVGPGAEGTNLALQAMGRGGAAVIPLLAATRSALKGINEETLKSGLVFSQEEVNNAKDLTIATREVHHSFEGLQVSLAKGFAPAFTELATQATTALDTINQVGDKVGGTVKNLHDRLLDLGNVGGKHGLIGDIVPKGVQDFLALGGGGAKSSADAYQLLADKLESAATAGDTMAATFEAGQGIIIKSSEASLGFADSLHSVAQSFADNGKTLDTNTDAGRKNADVILKAGLAAEAAGEAVGKASGNTEKGTKAADNYRAQLLALLEVQLGSAGAAEAFAKKFGLIDDAGIKAAHGVKLTKAQIEELLGLQPKISDFVKNFQSSIASATDPSSALTKASEGVSDTIKKAVDAAEAGTKVLVGKNLVPPEFFDPKIGPLTAKLNEARAILEKLPKDASDSAKRLAQGNVDAAKKALEDLPKDAHASLAAFQHELEVEIANVAAFDDNLIRLAQRGHIGLAEEFAKMGPSAAGVLADAVGQSDAALAPLEGDFRKRAELATGAVAAEIEQGSKDWASIMAVKGKLTAESLAQALGVAPSDTKAITDRVHLILDSLPPDTRVQVTAILNDQATAGVKAFNDAIAAARAATQNAITVKLAKSDPFNLAFSGNLGLSNKFSGRATGGVTHKGDEVHVGERGPELWVAASKGPKSGGAIEHLTKQAKTGADETLVRLGIPGGIEPRATRKGTPALLLGTQGPQTFTPPADGVVVNATDTKRLQRTEDPGIIERILKRAGADRKTLEALAAGPARAIGGPTTKDRQYQTGEKGPELFVPAQKASAIALTGHADKESRGALVRLALPGGIESTASHIGSPALLLGQHGPQMFTPPTDGVIVKASDTQRLRRTDDADIISRILKRAGLDKRSRDAIAGPTANAPARAQGGPVRQGSEPGDPTFAFSPKKSTTPTVASPGVKRGADGSYNITIGDTHLKVEGNTLGHDKGVNKSDVDKIVQRHQANLVQELTAALRSG